MDWLLAGPLPCFLPTKLWHITRSRRLAEHPTRLWVKKPDTCSAKRHVGAPEKWGTCAADPCLLCAI